MSDKPAGQTDSGVLPKVSSRWVRLVLWYAPRLVRKNFSAVRLLGDPPEVVADEPLLIYMNHPSWWDPVGVAVLTKKYFADRKGYGPIDGKGLEKYRFMEKLGFFGIDPTSRAGAAKFLRVGRAVLETPGAILWVTAEGHFTDPRKRPVRLRPGVAHLAAKAQAATVLPLAIEYPFGQEKQPEMRLAFGTPIRLRAAADDPAEGDPDAAPRTSAEWNALLEARLAETMDRLAAMTIAQDHEAMTLLSDGKRGVGGVYDVWRWLRAKVSGQKFDAAHGAKDDGGA